MKVRKFGAGIGATALVVSGLALAAAAPASADPSSTPSATDIVGVGSDTIEFVVGQLAAGRPADGLTGWNAAHPTQQIASFDATPQPSTIVLRPGHAAVARPNGSGQGKATLFGAGDNPDVNFARSSSTLNASNGEATSLTQFPFAVDGLKMAVSGLVTSNAPASLTAAQIVDIYKGTYKHWNEIDATWSSDFIHPLIPQSGSGTRSFFESELKAANGGVAVTYPAAGGGYPGVVEAQEHSPTQIQGDPDAIAPFSTARAQTLATPANIKLLGGYQAKRAVYDVVRNADAASQWATDIFGPTGFFCSPAAKAIIEANGFAQLASVDNGGVCGVGGTTAVSNFTTNTVTTTTALVATSPAGRKVTLTATVDGGDQKPDGDVEFFEGGTSLGSFPLTAGAKSINLSNVTPGQHTYSATYTSANQASFTDSTSADAQVTVKEVSTTALAVTPGSYGHAGSVKVTVTSASGSTGSATVKLGTLSLGTKALVAGTATFALPVNLTAGAKSVTATFSGNAEVAPSSATKAFTRAKSATKTAEGFAASVAKGKRAVGYVTVTLNPASTIKARGTIVVKKGTKVIGRGTLAANGKVKITLAKLPKGKNTLTASYGGSANTTASSVKFTIVQK